MFLAWEIHNHLDAWNVILQDYQDRETILGYISRKVNILDFLRPFRGVFKGVHYDSSFSSEEGHPEPPTVQGIRGIFFQGDSVLHSDWSGKSMG